jgi:hypothetical protein
MWRLTAPLGLKKMNDPGSTGGVVAAFEYVDQAEPRPSNRGVGAMLFIVIFGLLAAGIEPLWIGFLTWLLVWAISN